jgi:hypothetical protein
MRVHYLKEAGWEDEWISTAIDIAEDCWTKHYKANAVAADSENDPATQFGYSVST